MAKTPSTVSNSLKFLGRVQHRCNTKLGRGAKADSASNSICFKCYVLLLVVNAKQARVDT